LGYIDTLSWLQHYVTIVEVIHLREMMTFSSSDEKFIVEI